MSKGDWTRQTDSDLSTETLILIVDRICHEIRYGKTKGVAQKIVAQEFGFSYRKIHAIWNGRPYSEVVSVRRVIRSDNLKVK